MTYTATDDAGNSVTTSFDVIVTGKIMQSFFGQSQCENKASKLLSDMTYFLRHLVFIFISKTNRNTLPILLIFMSFVVIASRTGQNISEIILPSNITEEIIR